MFLRVYEERGKVEVFDLNALAEKAVALSLKILGRRAAARQP
jgi:hypothetical protein